MCDTFTYQSKIGSSYLGKNSDREPNEAQHIVAYPETIRNSNKVETTFIEVEHPATTCEVILSKPFQMWGAEMGCNEHGVAIGNEAVFTKIPFHKSEMGLTGMDLLRLSLELATSAKNAVEHIIYYLEKYGQNAPSGYYDKNFYYHNGFIVADKEESYILETAGKHWAYKRIIEGYRALSNGLSIEEDYDELSKDCIAYASNNLNYKPNYTFNFKQAYTQWLMPKLAAAKQRKQLSEECALAFSNFTTSNAFQILRTHATENFTPHQSNTQSVCMHASGLFTPHQTTGSMVVELRKNHPPTVWLTGSAAPCISVFKPFYFGQKILQESNLKQPTAIADDSYWWQWEQLHRNYIFNPIITKEFKQQQQLIEAKLVKEDNQLDYSADLSLKAIQQSLALKDYYLSQLKTTKKQAIPFLYQRFWKKYNKKANLKL